MADAGGPYFVDEGGSVQLDALDSDDDVGITRYEWDFDSDGVYDDSEESQPVFSAAALDGPRNVTVGLRVTDEDGADGCGDGDDPRAERGAHGLRPGR